MSRAVTPNIVERLKVGLAAPLTLFLLIGTTGGSIIIWAIFGATIAKAVIPYIPIAGVAAFLAIRSRRL